MLRALATSTVHGLAQFTQPEECQCLARAPALRPSSVLARLQVIARTVSHCGCPGHRRRPQRGQPGRQSPRQPWQVPVLLNGVRSEG